VQIAESSVLVTGGCALGLGYATGQALISRGAMVTLVDLPPASPGQATAEKLGPRARVVAANVADPVTIDAALDATAQDGDLGVVVHCAGRGGLLHVLDKDGHPSSLDFVEGLFGSFRARVAPFNVNYHVRVDELTYLLKDAAPVAIQYHPSFAPCSTTCCRTPQRVRTPSGRRREQAAPATRRRLLRGCTAGVPTELDVTLSSDDLHVLDTGARPMPKKLGTVADQWGHRAAGTRLEGDQHRWRKGNR
jgi:acyl-CoA synthetase (AMP-forming)/AMP-acid ligase II